MDGVILYSNDGKEKYQSAESHYNNNLHTHMSYSTLEVEAYGVNLKQNYNNKREYIKWLKLTNVHN